MKALVTEEGYVLFDAITEVFAEDDKAKVVTLSGNTYTVFSSYEDPHDQLADLVKKLAWETVVAEESE